MKFGVVTFPGSNCDEDMVYILQDVMSQSVERLWHKDKDLKNVDCIVLPGGFSYGDYLRSGAIAKLSPIMEQVIKHAQNGGYVIGICNGFQVLTESGLLDGALLHNSSQKFTCKNQELKAANNSSIITKELDLDRTYTIPIAHGEGRFYASDKVVKQLQDNDQILFRYASDEGVVDELNNPNGSVDNIAGIRNKEGNVLGMMPHPERAAADELGNTDGRILIESILKNC